GFDVVEPEAEAPPPPAKRREPAPEPPAPVAALPAVREPEPPVFEAPATVEPARARQPTPATMAAATNGAQRGQSGWLSNLLAAASRDLEEPRPALASRRPAGEGLDSITSDIARLVDDSAAAETWERWREGETNA